MENFAQKKADGAYNNLSGKRISACVPMHTFGLPCRIAEIAEICAEWGIVLIEDAAESLGSYVGSRHTGTFSSMATLSFNGNKVITTGGGGMIITDNPELARRAKFVTTTAKVSHPYEFDHSEIGYNYRMPNLNAALGCAQMERLGDHLSAKAEVTNLWDDFFRYSDVDLVKTIEGTRANNWLNAIIFKSRKDRDEFLMFTWS